MNSNTEQASELTPEKRRELLAELLRKKARAAKSYPLSFAQQRLWFLNRLEPGAPLYNLLTAVRLRGRLDVAALQRSLNEIVRRHEALRTTFNEFEGQPMQVITPEVKLTLAVEDLSVLPEPERETEAARLAREESERPFDLTRGPLLRVRLLRLSEGEHVALLAMHHIISDGWSIGVLIRELTVLYAAFQSGAPSPLAPLPIRYVDYARWQRKRMTGEVLEAELSYWKRQLAGAPAVLHLPTDRPRPPVRTVSGASFPLALSESLTAALRELSRREGVTLYMTLLAAFKALLHRYTGQEEVVVGTPVAGRTRAETEPLVGLFVNTLVLRTGLSGDPAFGELLKRVRATALGAHEHQEAPFERVVEALEVGRDLSRGPLFQVMFVLQNTPAPDAELRGLSVRPFDVRSTTAKFDLTLSVEEGPRCLTGSIEYSTDLFDAATIERLAGHFRTLLEGACADPSARLSELPLLTDPECRELLSPRSGAGADFSPGQCLHELFEQQAERTPGRVALTSEGERLTYAELNERANRLAHHLRRLGVGADTLVGICTERSVEMVVALLGTLKAGGAYLPLDPSYPHERLSFMLGDARVPVLLTQRRLLERLPAHGARVLCLDSDWQEVAGQSASNPPRVAAPDNLAYVIYTSGSTGTPKGAMVSHESAARLFTATDEWFRFDETDVWTLFHSYAFDFSVWELWGALLYGGRLVIVPYAVSRSPEAFRELLVRERVTVLNQTPSAFRQLMRADEAAPDPDELSLRLVIFGGEALELQSLRPWFERHGDERPRLVNMYGITETTVHVTYRPLKAADLSATAGSRIGHPIPDLQVYVLDRHMRPAPLGVPGEMYVGGAGLARGYLNRPELTAQRFVANPFTDEPGARLYRSGDLARRFADGDIEYLRRIDQQVKIRGFRIELGEVEAALREQEGVEDCVVVARQEEGGDKQLVAYLVAAGGEGAETHRLREGLRERLPEYMVPSAFVALDALPLTPNGKVDRKALPAPERSRPELAREYAAPRNEVEEALARIWAEALGVERVGVHDNFFELGGHSLILVVVLAKVRAAFGIEVPINTFISSTQEIEQMARFIKLRQIEEGGGDESATTSETSNARPPEKRVHPAPRAGDGGRRGGEKSPVRPDLMDEYDEHRPGARLREHASLVHIQPRGDAPPFFCVHPVGGNVACYADLSRHLGAGQPFYGLQSRGLRKELAADTRVEEMAAHYLEEVFEVQPEGPYLLGGWSMGGVVAYEMAQQLLRRGQSVLPPALFDARAAGPQERAADSESALLASFIRDLGLPLPLKQSLERVPSLEPEERLACLLEEAQTSGIVSGEVSLEYVRHLYRVFKLNLRALNNYLPQPFAGRITLFRASERFSAGGDDGTMGWGRLASGGVELHVVPGDHYSMMREPLVKSLAGKLKLSLVKVVTVQL